MKKWKTKPIKLIASDIDGTLKLQRSMLIEEKTISSFKDLQRNSIYSVLTTGNNTFNTKIFNKQVYLNEYGRYFISCGGAVVYDVKADKAIYEKSFDKKSQTKWISWAISNNFLVALDDTNLVFSPENKFKLFFFNLFKTYKKIDQRFSKFKNYNKINWNKKYNKIDIWTLLDEETAKKTFQEVKKLFPKLDINLMDLNCIQATEKGVNKGSAVKLLLKKLKIDPNQTIAIGDSMNDISMFKVVGNSITLENAKTEIKKIAHHITGNHEEHGFSNAMEKILKQNNEKRK